MERHKKRFGERMDKMERDRKREARKVSVLRLLFSIIDYSHNMNCFLHRHTKFQSLLKSLLVGERKCLIRKDLKKKQRFGKPCLCIKKGRTSTPMMIKLQRVSITNVIHKTCIFFQLLNSNSVGAVPAYLLDRENVTRAKILSNTVKQKRKEKVR